MFEIRKSVSRNKKFSIKLNKQKKPHGMYLTPKTYDISENDHKKILDFSSWQPTDSLLSSLNTYLVNYKLETSEGRR